MPVGRNTTSVQFARRNLAELHCKFFRQHRTKKTSSAVKKILSASVCKKNCAMSAGKYQSRLYNDRCRLLYFVLNPWIIYGWCLIGNVRSASPGDFFVDLDRQTFLADVGYHFFRSVSGNHVFFCRGWLVFSMPGKWKHAGVGRNTTSVHLKRKNLADLHCKFLRQHRTKKHPLP